jgi:hypothetical protein
VLALRAHTVLVDSDPELLGDEPVRLPRRRPESEPEREVHDRRVSRAWRAAAWVVVAAVLVTAVGSLAWHVDQRDRRREAAALTDCQRGLHEATILSDLQLGLVASGAREQASRAEVMARPARQVLPEVVDADRACRAVSVRPWHFALHARRDAVTAYSTALAAKLRAVASDGHDYYRDDPDLRRLRRAADIGVIGGRF